MASRTLSRIQVLTQTAPEPALAMAAGIPVNYDEAKAGGYTLPDPLTLLNARFLKARTSLHRLEMVRLHEADQFRKAPGKPANVTYDVNECGGSAFAGKSFHADPGYHMHADGHGTLLPEFNIFPKSVGLQSPL